MDRCPDETCHDLVIKLAFFMKIVGASIGIAVVIFGLVLHAQERKAEKRDQKIEQVPVIQQMLINMANNMEALNMRMTAMENNTTEIQKEIAKQISKEDIDRLIRELRKEEKEVGNWRFNGSRQ